MGASSSKVYPPGTFCSNATGEEVTPYSIRRHPDFANGVLGLPKDMPNAQVFYLKAVEKYKDRPYVGTRLIHEGKRDSEFTYVTYGESFDKAKKFGAGLVKHGVQNTTKVCIFSENRHEWFVTMDASYLYGYVTVALYDTFTTDALEFSVQNCKAEYICVSRKNLAAMMKAKDEVLQQFKLVVTFDPITTEDDKAAQAKFEKLGVQFLTFDAIIETGEGFDAPYAEIDPEQLLYVCYSSGTTGFPKGVMISHRSFITNLLGIEREGDDETFARHLSYLPLCHVFERMCSSCAVYHGGKIGVFSGSVAKLSEDLQALKPTVMPVVPRVLQRMQSVIEAQLRKSGAVTRTVFNGAWYAKRFLMMRGLPYGLLDRLVFNHVKKNMGGELVQICNGGAALPADIHEFMQVVLGIPIRPGYGLSEGGSGNTLNPRDVRLIKLGTSGYPLANVQLRIVRQEDFTEPGVGEIQMGGSGLCSGYLNDEQATADLFTDESHEWIHTGDIGRFDEDNSLVVVDRMRSIFKLSQGEYVAGDLLAQYFEAAELVSSIFVFGDSTRQCLVGIVLPDKGAVGRFLGNKQLTDDEFTAACNSPELNKAVKAQLDTIAVEKKLLGYQKIAAVQCVNDEWTVDNGLLSPTFKPKRKLLTARYAKEIDQLYKGLDRK